MKKKKTGKRVFPRELRERIWIFYVSASEQNSEPHYVYEYERIKKFDNFQSRRMLFRPPPTEIPASKANTDVSENTVPHLVIDEAGLRTYVEKYSEK